MKAAKTQKNLKEMPYPPQEKDFNKKRKQYYTNKDKYPNFTNLFRRPKISNSNLSTEKQRTENEVWTTSRGNTKSIFASYC